MEAKLLAFDIDNPDLDDINSIFRCAHSIKGGAGAFGFKQMATITHSLESLLDIMRQGDIKVSKEIIDILLGAVDLLNKLVNCAQNDQELDQEIVESAKRKIDLVSGKYQHDAPNHEPPAQNIEAINGVSLYKINFIPSSDLLLSGNEPLLLIKELETLGQLIIATDTSKIPDINNLDPNVCYLSWEFGLETSSPINKIKEVFEFVEDLCSLEIVELGGAFGSSDPAVEVATEVKQTEEVKSPKNNEAKSDGNKNNLNNTTSIRVDISKIDRIVNMVGELVITQSMLVSQSKDLLLKEFTGLAKGIEDLSQHSRDLQEAVMSIRMQPIKSIFVRLPRVLRELAAELSKEVTIEFHGEGTEVDKSIIELLTDPILHLLRNSVDHGIELPDIRAAKNKNPTGAIKISASHQSGRIVIEIEDDGAGINREKVLAKARERGLVKENESLSDEEIDKLICLPGFSTAEKLTSISGRGVGMDVVKSNIEALGGNLKISNFPGKKCSFIMTIPLTLAILDGMVVRVANENYIIPINNIIETIGVDQEAIKHITGSSNVINVRGELIPVLRLSTLFNINMAGFENKEELVVLVESGNDKFGLIVDQLEAQQQVVIKSLEPNLDPILGISGATILGNGKVSLIIDIGKLEKIAFDKKKIKEVINCN
jgi:two-component system chemotaxis sensor kinase CheA